MERSPIIIILIMSIAGFFGGLINYFINKKDKKLSIFLGLAASFMVPLFLHMTSSNLLEQIRGSETNAGNPLKYFDLAAICLVVAISSRAFIWNMSALFLRGLEEMRKETKQTGNEVTNIKDNVELLMRGKTEVDQDEEVKGQLSEDQRKVLTEMAKGKFVLRTTRGIAKDTSLSYDSVKQAIDDLILKGLVEQRVREGGPRWVITLEGRKNVLNNK